MLYCRNYGSILEVWDETPATLSVETGSELLAARIAIGEAHDRANAGLFEKDYKKALGDVYEILAGFFSKVGR